MLPAPELLTACSLEYSQDISLFAQGMAMTNVDVSLAWEYALQRDNRCCVVWMSRRGHRFLLCIGKVFQSLSALGLHVARLSAAEALSLIVADSFFASLVMSLPLTSLPLPLPLLSLPLPLLFGFAPNCIGIG